MVVPGVHGNDIVFQKQLLPQKNIQVLRHEIANTPPTEAAPAGLVYIKPDHVYQYDFFLLGPHNQKTKLWSHKFLSFAPDSFLPTDFQVLDVDIQDKALIVVYKDFCTSHGGTTFANIISDVSKSEEKELPRNEAQLTYDSDGRHVFISSAKIAGSIKEETLNVSLKNVDSSFLFLWKDQRWQRVSEAVPDPMEK